jgi:hypothetical protein
MVKYVDNGVVLGWYYVTSDGFYYGDGTKEMAYSILKDREDLEKMGVVF